MTLSVSSPEPLPSPRGAHLQMVGAVLAGEGLERIADIASEHVGAPVAVVVPRVGVAVEAWSRYERYVSSRLSGGRPDTPEEVVAEVPISSGGKELGLVLMLGPGVANAGEYLHVAAVAALTEVAVVEASSSCAARSSRSFFIATTSTRRIWSDEPGGSARTSATGPWPYARFLGTVRRAACSPSSPRSARTRSPRR